MHSFIFHPQSRHFRRVGGRIFEGAAQVGEATFEGGDQVFGLLQLCPTLAFRFGSFLALRGDSRRQAGIRLFRGSGLTGHLLRCFSLGAQFAVGSLEDGQDFRSLLGPDLPYLRRQRVHQVAVVRDEQDGAGVGFEYLFEDFLRGDVEVVGGFVEQQQVGVFECQLGQRQTSAFAA